MNLKLLLRRAVHFAATVLLRLRSRPCSFDPAVVFLVIAPHPDDDVLGCGGLIAHLRSQGNPVHILYITDGSASHPGHPVLTAPVLEAQRIQEARDAVASLGVEEIALHFLGARDGGLSRLSSVDALSVPAQIAGTLRETTPDVILLPWRFDGSDEHAAAFDLVMQAIDQTDCRARVLEFPVWAHWRAYLLLKALRPAWRVFRFTFEGSGTLKMRAIGIHASQTRPVPPWTEPVLSAEFVSMFSRPEEFFLEIQDGSDAGVPNGKTQ